jgi:hypothetical protein
MAKWAVHSKSEGGQTVPIVLRRKSLLDSHPTKSFHRRISSALTRKAKRKLRSKGKTHSPQFTANS